jgi:hypothetical protein
VRLSFYGPDLVIANIIADALPIAEVYEPNVEDAMPRNR